MITLLNKYFQVAKIGFSKSNLEHRVAKSAFWSLTGGIFSRFFTIITAIVTARILGKIGYGELGIIQSTLGIFGVLAGMGLGALSTKYIAEFRDNNPARAGAVAQLTIYISFISAGALSFVCLCLSPFIAANILERPELSSLLAIGSLFLFFTTIGGVQFATLNGFEAFKEVACLNIIQGLLTPIITIPLVWMYGVKGAVVALTIHSAIACMISAFSTRKQKQIYKIPKANLRDILIEWPMIWAFGIPAMLSGLMVVPVTWIANLILIRQSDGYGELGLFNAANQWIAIVVYLPGLLSTAMLPVLSSTHSQCDKSDFHKAFEMNLRATWIVALPLAILGVTMGAPLGNMFGKNFEGIEPILAVLILASFFNIANTPVGTALAGAGRIWVGMFFNLLWGLALIIFTTFWAPKYGAFGLGSAYLAAYTLHSIWQMVYVEIKLTRKIIVRQWRLFVFSLLLLSVSCYMGISSTYTLTSAIFLLPLSLIPLLLSIRSRYF